jgi:hypothetical protein
VTAFGPSLMKTVWESGDFGFDLADSFDIHKNEESIQKAGAQQGGASGELFFFSHDKRLIFKTINQSETTLFKEMMWDYAMYMKNHPKTFIGRIFGLFTFSFKGQDTSITIILQENIFLFPREIALREYDMKGIPPTHKYFYRKYLSQKGPQGKLR